MVDYGDWQSIHTILQPISHIFTTLQLALCSTPCYVLIEKCVCGSCTTNPVITGSGITLHDRWLLTRQTGAFHQHPYADVLQHHHHKTLSPDKTHYRTSLLAGLCSFFLIKNNLHLAHRQYENLWCRACSNMSNGSQRGKITTIIDGLAGRGHIGSSRSKINRCYVHGCWIFGLLQYYYTMFQAQ